MDPIARLVYAYAERLDAGDFEGVAALFEHGRFGSEGYTTFEGRDGVLKMLQGMVQLYDGVPRTKHVVTNLVVDLDDVASTATARSYFTVLQATDGFPLQPVIAGRYEDAFARKGSHEWHFTDRRVHMDLLGDLSHHLKSGVG